MQDIREAVSEVLQAVIPIILVIVILEVGVLRVSPSDLLQFLLGSGMVIFGIALFLAGVKADLLPVGEAIGSELPARGSLALVVLGAFLFGFLATIAEPDVRVLQVWSIPSSAGGAPQEPRVIVIGVGVCLVAAAVLRIVLGVPIAYLFAAGYGTFSCAAHAVDFMAIVFDARGVTTDH